MYSSVHETEINISIHAPLAGCDAKRHNQHGDKTHFNPRTPCGVRPFRVPVDTHSIEFQSTHPLRGATSPFPLGRFFAHISIHAPLAGCDAVACAIHREAGSFQSTHPLRGATAFHRRVSLAERFQSTHPLRGATVYMGLLLS